MATFQQLVDQVAGKKDPAGNGAAEARELLALPVVELPAAPWDLPEAHTSCPGSGECACSVDRKGEES